MSMRRVLAAAAILLAAAYLRVCMPSFYDDLVPAVREAIALRQVELHLPEAVLAWAASN